MKNNFQKDFEFDPFNFQLIFHIFEEVILSSLMKIIELLEVYEFEIFSNEIQTFSTTFSFNLNGRSHVIFSLGFCVEKHLNSWRFIKAK